MDNAWKPTVTCPSCRVAEPITALRHPQPLKSIYDPKRHPKHLPPSACVLHCRRCNCLWIVREKPQWMEWED